MPKKKRAPETPPSSTRVPNGMVAAEDAPPAPNDHSPSTPDVGIPHYPSTPPELIDGGAVPLPTPTHAAEAETRHAADGDPFDAAIADRAAGRFSEPAVGREAPRGHPAAGFASRVEKQPDPFAEYRISLTREDGGPAMRLFRNRFQNLAAIRFDEKPSAPVRAQLQAGGFSWRQQDRVWVKPLGPRPGEEHRRALELFEGLADQIRAENRMPPIEKGGPAV